MNARAPHRRRGPPGWPWALLLALLLPWMPASHAEETLRIGVLAFRPAPETLARWQPTADYLQQALPDYRFEVLPLGYRELEAAIAGGQVDLVLTNPSHYIVLQQRFDALRIATLMVEEQGRTLTAFGGVIAVRADDAALQALSDLRGRRVASPQQESLGGYQVQALELQAAGVAPDQDLRVHFTGMPHDRAIEALLAGEADAAFVRTGLIEAMSAEGRLDPARLRILNRQQVASFPFLLSSRLYPEWPLAALPHIDDSLNRRIVLALLGMPPGSAAARQGQYTGWTVPADYEPVRRLLEGLSLPPYDTQTGAAGRGHGGLAQAAWLPAALLLALLLTLALLALQTLRMQRLQAAQQAQLRELDNEEVRFRALVDNLPGAVYRCRNDSEWTMLYLSEHVQDLTGYPASNFLNGLIYFADLYHPQDLARIRTEVDAAIHAGRPFELDYRIRHADGGWRHIHERGRLVRSTDGQQDWIDGVLFEAARHAPAD